MISGTNGAVCYQTYILVALPETVLVGVILQHGIVAPATLPQNMSYPTFLFLSFLDRFTLSRIQRSIADATLLFSRLPRDPRT
jgi:hypothetical protein